MFQRWCCVDDRSASSIKENIEQGLLSWWRSPRERVSTLFYTFYSKKEEAWVRRITSTITGTWPLRESLQPAIYVVVRLKRRLSRAIRSKTIGQRESKVCKRIGVRQGPVLIVETRGQGQDLLSRIVTFTLFNMLLQYNLNITLPLIYCRKNSYTDLSRL